MTKKRKNRGDGHNTTGSHEPKKPKTASEKPTSSSQVSSQRSEKRERAREILALQAQLSYQLKDDKELYAEYVELAGQRITEAALNLGQVLDLEQSRILSNAPTAPNTINMPLMGSYLSSAPEPKPALPPILDPKLRDLPFIHRGSLSDHVASHDHNSYYDRIEFLGDAFIEVAASRLLYDTYPNIPVSRLAYLREDLVKNETLAQYSMLYGFDEKLRAYGSIYQMEARGAKQNKNFTKILGDVFEAYTAAVILSDPKNAYGAVESWLCALWRRRLPGQKEVEEPYKLAKSDLAKKVLGKGITLDYLESEPPRDAGLPGKLLFSVVVKITGWGWEKQELGRGCAWNKQDAGIAAATEAIMNPLTAQIGEIKKHYDALVKEEREKEGGPDPEVIEKLDATWKFSSAKEKLPTS